LSFSPDEVRFLSARADDIARVAASGEIALTKKSAISDRTALSKLFGENARAVMELLQARQTLAPKLELPASAAVLAGAGATNAAGASGFAGNASDWLADSDSAQQATPLAVSQVRAERIAAAGAALVHDVTCSIGTEAPAVIAAGMDWLGTDLDYSRLLMARANLAQTSAQAGAGAVSSTSGRAWVAQADALAPVTTPASSPGPRIRACSGTGSRPGRVIVADPARRADGRRITDPAKLIPPLPDLVDAHRGAAMAVKCAPGIDYSDWHGLVSVVSVGGGAKEACLYTPDLAEPATPGRQW